MISDGELVGLVGVTGLVEAATVSLVAFYGWKYWGARTRNLKSWRKRGGLQVMCLTLVFLLFAVVCAPTFLSLVLGGGKKKTSSAKFAMLECYFVCQPLLLFMHVQCYRFWMLFYRSHYYTFMAQHKWRRIIDIKWNEGDFWLTNKGTVGMSRNAGVAFVFLFVVESVIDTLVQVFHSHSTAWHLTWIQGWLLGADLALLTLAWLCPAWFHKYKIPSEMKHVAVVSTIVALLFAAIYSAAHYVSVLRLAFFQVWIALFGMAAICMVSFWFTLHVLDKDLPQLMRQMSLNSQLKQPVNASNRRMLVGMLEREDGSGVEDFMAHLSREFSPELLCSVLEVTQWKILLKKDDHFMVRVLTRKERKVGDLISTAANDLKLPGSMPQSSIVHGHYDKLMEELFESIYGRPALGLASIYSNSSRVDRPLRSSSSALPVLVDRLSESVSSMTSKSPTKASPGSDLQISERVVESSNELTLRILAYKHIAYLLWAKYSEGEYEVNISFETKRSMQMVLGSYEQWMRAPIKDRELFGLFDRLNNQMLILMTHSFTRSQQI